MKKGPNCKFENGIRTQLKGKKNIGNEAGVDQNPEVNANNDADKVSPESNLSKDSQADPNFGPWMLVRYQSRKINEKGRSRSRGGYVSKESIPKGNNANVTNNDSGTRFEALNQESTDEDEDSQHEDVTLHEAVHPVPMQSGPNTALTKRAQNQGFVSQIQKRILKPEAGKNTQAHKKSPPKLGPVQTTRKSKGKNKSITLQPVTNTALATIPPSQPSTSCNEEMELQNKSILEEMSKLRREQADAYEASKMIPILLKMSLSKTPS
ncbi:hypothetical protein PIB30_007150 [Stylosanthes scabra]|uniref:Uncharacterized protein n=1 Tax=Stylosanthes scabra TaxID=79078 RepID=A0ABU6T4U3_9FABA|nr:hypothetical protein [Stylosanthes scabra]